MGLGDGLVMGRKGVCEMGDGEACGEGLFCVTWRLRWESASDTAQPGGGLEGV